MGRSRIPETIAEFNTYINNTDDYNQAGGPPTNRERLGLSIANGTDWSTKRVYWRDTLFPKHSNPLTKTPAVNAEVVTFMEDFREFGNPLLEIIAADPDVTSDDALVYNIDIERAEPSIPTTKITDPVVHEHRALNGGMVEFVCRPSHDSKKASKHKDSDSIQLAYILPSQTTPGPEPGGGSDMPDPDSEDMVKEIFTKAVFIKAFGAGKKSKLAICYLRWYSTKRPHLSGPWTSPILIGID